MRKTLFAASALTLLLSGEVYSQTTWNTVANEYQQFSLSSSQNVRYGAGSSWIQKTLSGTQSCTNQTFGRDPAYGVTKVCQVAAVTSTTSSGSTSTSTSTSTNTTTSGSTTWSTVANEYASFSLSGTKTVRYGAGSSWVEKSLSGTQSCTNQTFGRDPAYGVAKICQVASTTSTATTGSTSGTTSGSTSTTTATWSTIANEYANFSLSSTKTVRYGAGSSWIEKSLSGTQSCTNQTFGRDPAYGVTKICQVATLASTSTSGSTSGSTAGSTGGTTGSTGGSTGSTGGTTTTPTAYSASLSWTIPSTRTNGSPLLVSELRGYEVYYTNDSGSVSTSIPVSGATTVRTVVSNLTSGRYYFSISAIDVNGLKSPLSTVAPITFP